MKWLFALVVVIVSIDSFAEIKASGDSDTLSFAGEHAGMKFAGEFQEWQAQLLLPPADSPSIKAQFTLASAKTGDATYDETLPEGDWFDAKNHPIAMFKSETVTANGDEYEVSGNLTIKGITQPVDFTLRDQQNALKAEFRIDRLAFNIGKESDPEADWGQPIYRHDPDN